MSSALLDALLGYDSFNASGHGSGPSSFDHAMLSAVWHKAGVVCGYDQNQYRIDRFGSWIAWAEYGQTTGCGWEVDHIFPKAHGGSDELFNLQPLQWNNNRTKGTSLVGLLVSP